MKVGFIGCGNMGTAMVSGILKKGLFPKEEIIVSNLTEEGAERSREKLGVAEPDFISCSKASVL